MSRDGAVGAARRPRVWAGLLAAAVVLFVGGTVWAVVAPGASYGWRRSMISDMGALTCLERAQRWICSPRHAAFNAAQVGAGLLLLVAAATPAFTARPGVRPRPAPERGGRAGESPSAVTVCASERGGRGRQASSMAESSTPAGRAAPAWPLRAAAASAGVGLVGLGVFPSDVAHAAHMGAAVVALPVSAAFLLVDGVRSRAVERAVLGGSALGLSAIHLVPGDALRGVAELVSLAALCLAFLLEAVRASRRS